jgi:hypothetical protein
MPDWNDNRREGRSFREDARYDRERMSQGRDDDRDFHPDYLDWREEQLRMHDRDYHAWREERRRGYDEDYRRRRAGGGWGPSQHNISRGMPSQDTDLGAGGTWRPERAGFGRGDDAPSGALEPRGSINRRW